MSETDSVLAAVRRLPGVAAAELADPHDPHSLRLELQDGVDGQVISELASRLLHEHVEPRAGAAQHTIDAPLPDGAPDATTTAPSTTGVPLPSSRGPRADRLDADPHQGRRRPGIVRTDTALADLDARAHVVLSSAVGTVAGDAVGAATQRGLHAAIARATLLALEELAGGRVRLELDHVLLARHDDDRTALVSVTLVSESGAERLSGSAVVRDDETRAIVRAALDAVNRRFEVMVL